MADSKTPEIRILTASERDLLDDVAPGVFDNPIDPRRADEFLRDDRHHLAVAVSDGTVVGMASAVHYVHPDKEPELWINEIGVADSFRRTGLGKRLLDALLQHARTLGCRTAWLVTKRDNAAARQLFASAGGQEATEEAVLVNFLLTLTDGEANE
jgi:aminoglycoside 6'-N-acetyltransferase I